MENNQVIHFYPTWTSEIVVTSLFVVSVIVSIYLTENNPGSIISGELISVGSFVLYLNLPLFWLPPFFILAYGMFGIYNTRYVLDGDGVYSKDGILSISQKAYRVRYQDIKSIELKQSLLGRLFNYGDILIGSAALGIIEITLRGISSPEEVQEMIINERDRTQKLEAQNYVKVIDEEIEKGVNEREAFRKKFAENSN